MAELVLELHLDVINQTITYKDVEKAIPNSYWKDTLVPMMYPLWDTDKDKLINFYHYSNGSYSAQRRKFIRNFATNTDEWKDYEMESIQNSDGDTFRDKILEGFYLIDSLENQDFQNELASMYAKQQAVSPLTVRLARNFLLSETDWTQSVTDSGLSADDKAMYVTYRTKLRDITTTYEFNNNIDEVKFPISPEFYNKIYKVDNPGEDYLATDRQFLSLARHYLMTLREKCAHYMLTKSFTEASSFSLLFNEYNKRKIDSPVQDVASNEQLQARKDFLEKLIEKVNDEINNPDFDQNGGL